MIWIYPDEDPILDRHAGLYFSYPELIDISAMQNQVIPATQPGCMATLPYCGPLNSFFNWEGPFGQTPPPSPSGQPVLINVNDPFNVGTWTFTLTMPNATIISPMPCSSQGAVTGSVAISNVCNAPVVIWPKVYSYARAPNCLLKDNANNFVVKFLATNITQNINHSGFFPTTPPGINHELTLHYNNSGETSWYIEHTLTPSYDEPQFITSAGDIQWSGSPNTLYTNSASGNPSNGPSILPSPTNEIIIAEINSNAFITKTSSTINLHSSNGISSISINGSIITKFNPFTNKFFIVETALTSPFITSFTVYNVNNNGTFSFVKSNFIPNLAFVQIDNTNTTDNSYFIDSHILVRYDYQNNIFTPVSISNFTNNNIYGIHSNNPLTENRCLIVNRVEGKIYSLDLVSSTSNFLSTLNLPYNDNLPAIQWLSFNYHFAYYLDDVYITGGTQSGNDLQIGNQLIPALGNFQHSVFFTKFNLSEFSFSKTSDNYSFKQTPNDYSLEASQKTSKIYQADNLKPKVIFDGVVLSPNPVRDLLSISMPTNNNFSSNSLHTISIYNNVGVKVLELKKTGKTIFIDTQKLNAGSYFILLRDEKGNRSSKSFVKI